MYSQLKHIHFIGIGGIGMSALARYFLKSGKMVSGYDKVIFFKIQTVCVYHG